MERLSHREKGTFSRGCTSHGKEKWWSDGLNKGTEPTGRKERRGLPVHPGEGLVTEVDGIGKAPKNGWVGRCTEKGTALESLFNDITGMETAIEH